MEARGFAAQVLEAEDAEGARRVIEENPDLDLAVLDLYMPGMERCAFLEDVRAAKPDLAVVVLTASEKRHDLQAVMKAGATGYIPKTFSVAEILQALQRILQGEAFFPADVGGGSSLPPELQGLSLSPRQKEVLELIAKGYSNKEIARTLDTALPTVKNHVANIFEKLGTSNRVAAVNVGRKAGLIPDE